MRRQLLTFIRMVLAASLITSLPFPVAISAPQDAEPPKANAPAPAAASISNPQVLMDEVYEIVGNACQEGAKGETYDPAALARNYFTPFLYDLYDRAVSTGSIDFDIFTDSQDCGVTNLKVKIRPSEEKGDFEGIAQFENFGEERAIVFLLKRLSTGFLIDNVRYAHREFDLRKDY